MSPSINTEISILVFQTGKVTLFRDSVWEIVQTIPGPETRW